MDIFAPSHLLILLLIILVIFGPSKLGDVGGAMGRAIKDFKRAMNEPENSETRSKVVTDAPAVEVKPDKHA
jgi:sec-independent protein translocase protein TatA